MKYLPHYNALPPVSKLVCVIIHHEGRRLAAHKRETCNTFASLRFPTEWNLCALHSNSHTCMVLHSNPSIQVKSQNNIFTSQRELYKVGVLVVVLAYVLQYSAKSSWLRCCNSCPVALEAVKATEMLLVYSLLQFSDQIVCMPTVLTVSKLWEVLRGFQSSWPGASLISSSQWLQQKLHCLWKVVLVK